MGESFRGDNKRNLSPEKEELPIKDIKNSIHAAAITGDVEVVASLLLSSKSNVNSQDSAGYTVIQRAAAEGHVEIVKLLIKFGANVNIQDKVHGNTALHEACWKGYSKCVKALCHAQGVNLDVKNFGGFAPLHLACQNGHNQCCRQLLTSDCNPDIQNNYGDTPLHTSARYGHAGVTRILISANCHMSDQNKNGDTALHITAAMGRRKLTRILLECGCDPNCYNKQKERAKDIALRKKLYDIVEIIDNTPSFRRKEENKEKKKRLKVKEEEKKRGKNESGSSKDSTEKKKQKNEKENRLETNWSPYGCHYYPDPKTFPKPKLDSLPSEPLKKGEQYYLDLAGNIKKGPVGIGYTCYCALFYEHMEERLKRNKKELKGEMEAAHLRLNKKVTNLEEKTRDHLNEITKAIAVEREKCQERHHHLEQWLVRGTFLRHSEKPSTTFQFDSNLHKSKSLENLLAEEKQFCHQNNFYRSEEILNASKCFIPRHLGHRSGFTKEEEADQKMMKTFDENDNLALQHLNNCCSSEEEGEKGETSQLERRETKDWRNDQTTCHSSGEIEKFGFSDKVANRKADKLGKKQAVEELLAKIHKKTGIIHKSAQKWKKSKEKKKLTVIESEKITEDSVLNKKLPKLRNPESCPNSDSTKELSLGIMDSYRHFMYAMPLTTNLNSINLVLPR